MCSNICRHPRRSSLPALVALILVIGVTSGCSIRQSMPAWLGGEIELAEDSSSPFIEYEQAISSASENGKPVCLFFTGSDWCTWCLRLQDEVFLTPEFEQWARDNVALVEVDFPQSKLLPGDQKVLNETLKQQYGEHIDGFPTALFVSADGEVLGKLGYEKGGPQAWIRKAETVLDNSSP